MAGIVDLTWTLKNFTRILKEVRVPNFGILEFWNSGTLELHILHDYYGVSLCESKPFLGIFHVIHSFVPPCLWFERDLSHTSFRAKLMTFCQHANINLDINLHINQTPILPAVFWTCSAMENVRPFTRYSYLWSGLRSHTYAVAVIAFLISAPLIGSRCDFYSRSSTLDPDWARVVLANPARFCPSTTSKQILPRYPSTE